MYSCFSAKNYKQLIFSQDYELPNQFSCPEFNYTGID
jgi:hypothetical protein